MRKRKKLLSLLTAVALCVSYMVPIAALAAAGESVGEGVANAIQQVAMQSSENDIAVQSASDVEAEVTIGDQTTSYDDIDDAFAAAQDAESAIVKLLKSVTVNNGGNYDQGIELIKGNITLDLNGMIINQRSRQNMTGSDYGRYSVFYLKGGSLTIQDASVGKSGKIEQSNGLPAVLVRGNASLTMASGTIENTNSTDHRGDNSSAWERNCAIAITGDAYATINGGTLKGLRGVVLSMNGSNLTVTGGDISGTTGNALIVYGGAAQLYGGAFRSSDTHSIWVTSGKAESLLAEGCSYVKDDGTPSSYSTDDNGVVGNTIVNNPNETPVNYINDKGELSTQTNYTELTSKGFASTNYDGTYWFAAKENVTVEDVLSAHGTINLILCDGATVIASGGVTLESKETQPATLNIYAQNAGTGRLVATGTSSNAVMTAGIRNANSGTGEATLNIYGGTVESTGANSAVVVGEDDYSGAGIGTYAGDTSNNTLNVNIYGGMVIAQSGGKGGAAIGNGQGSNGTVNVTIAEGMKCVKTDEPTVKAEYGNIDGTSVTITKCVDHQWSYTNNGDTHAATCKLCSKARATESHSYASWKPNEGGTTHTGTCVCGATSTVDHTFTYHLSADKRSHYGECDDCGHKSAEELHNNNGENDSCSVCGASADVAEEKVEVIITAHNGTVTTKRYTDLLEAFNDADISQATKIEISLLQGKKTYTLNSMKAYPIKFQYTHDVEVIVDLNGCTLKRSVDAETKGILSVENGSVTFKNGMLELDDSASLNPAQAIKIPAGHSPALALENMTVNAVRGYAINAAGEGTLCVKSGTYGDVLINDNFAAAQLSGGSYKTIECYKDYAKLLEAGYIFAKQSDSSYIDPSTMSNNAGADQNIKNIQIIECKHEGGYIDGKCRRCDYECGHKTIGTDSKCAVCQTQMAAKVGENNYFATLAAAIEAAKSSDTVTLLADVDNANIASSFKLDCNGHTIGTLTIGEGIELDSLLLDGYAFKSGDSWITNESGKSFNNVTTAEAPVKSVTANNPNISVKYGESYTLSTTFAWTGDANSSDMLIEWAYKDDITIGSTIPTLTDYSDNKRTIKYELGTSSKSGYPAQTGTYTYVVAFTKDGYSKSCEFNVTIEKGQAEVTTAPAAKESLVYSDNEQALVTAGTANGGEMRYSLEKDGTYSAEIPTAITAGEHVVWYKAVGDDNHNDSVPASIKVTIAQATPVCNAPTDVTAVYGQKLSEIALANPSGNTPGMWVWADGTQNVGNYGDNTFKAIFAPTDAVNYKTVSNINVTVKVGKAEGSVTAPVAKKLTYNGEEQALVEAATSETGTVEYSIGNSNVWRKSIPTAKNAGSYVVNYRVIGDGNHKDVAAAGVTVTIAPAPVTVTAKDKSVNVGEKAPDLSAPKLGSDYMVAGLFGGDTLTTAPALKYADANGNDITPDTTKAGEAAKIVASGANAGNNYTISCTPGKLTVSVPYTPSPAPDPTPSPKPDPSPNPEPDQPSDPSTPDTPQLPAKGDAVTAGTGSAQLGFTVTGVADASGKGGTVAFAGCSKSAKKVTVPASIEINGVSYAVTEIAPGAFKNCKKLTKVTVPNFISKIGKGAFQGCTNLKSVTLGSGLKSIGKEAFKGCKSLRTIIITSNQLSKKSIKDCLKGSKVESIIVQVGSKKQNKKAAEKYAKIFTKKIAGKKAKVKASKKPLKK